MLKPITNCPCCQTKLKHKKISGIYNLASEKVLHCPKCYSNFPVNSQVELRPTTLSNGRVVSEERLANGAKEAKMVDGGFMAEDEWLEYCRIIVEKKGHLHRVEKRDNRKAASL